MNSKIVFQAEPCGVPLASGMSRANFQKKIMRALRGMLF